MPKNFPTDSKTDFIICENIRQESGGKLALMGYTANSILQLLHPEFPSAVTMAFAFVFRDGEGEFSGELEIRDPKGESLGTAELEKVTKSPTLPHVAYTNVPMLPIAMEGYFTVILTLDKKQQYKRGFTIKLRDAANSPSNSG